MNYANESHCFFPMKKKLEKRWKKNNENTPQQSEPKKERKREITRGKKVKASENAMLIETSLSDDDCISYFVGCFSRCLDPLIFATGFQRPYFSCSDFSIIRIFWSAWSVCIVELLLFGVLWLGSTFLFTLALKLNVIKRRKMAVAPRNYGQQWECHRQLNAENETKNFHIQIQSIIIIKHETISAPSQRSVAVLLVLLLLWA